MGRYLLLLAAAGLSACATTPCEPVVQVQRVDVPVPVARVAPVELLECPNLPAPPVFIDPYPTGPRGPAASGLTAEGEQALRAFVEAHRACVEAWRAWESSP